MFTDKEIAYIKSQRLARIATANANGQPDVAPVSFGFDGQRFTVGGFDITRTFKYKNVHAGNSKVSLVIDDLVSISPWQARGIKVHGTAEVVKGPDRTYLLITPVRHWSWGVEEEAFKDGKPVSRKAKHSA